MVDNTDHVKPSRTTWTIDFREETAKHRFQTQEILGRYFIYQLLIIIQKFAEKAYCVWRKKLLLYKASSQSFSERLIFNLIFSSVAVGWKFS